MRRGAEDFSMKTEFEWKGEQSEVIPEKDSIDRRGT